jgi:hypothetical protein
MTLDDVLGDLILRIPPKDNGIISWEQVREWPEEAVEIFQNAGWIKPKEPAQTVVCPGCEENCFMPVHVRKSPKGLVKAFVTCDKLDYMGPILIPLNDLKQWQITEKQVAEWIGCELGIRSKPKKDKDTGNFLIGNMQGKKRTGPLELVCTEPVSLKASGYFLPLNEVVFFDEDQLTIDWKATFSMVDRPSPSNRYKPSIARREVNKLDTQTRHKGWQKAYRELKRKNSDRSDNWCALQIAKMPIGKNYSSETIRKNMKK